MDLIIGVIAVVAWLIIQGAAASKKGKPPSPPPPVSSDPNEPVSPGDELRKFFENMQKEMAGEVDQKPSPPTPPPQHQKPRRPPRPARRMPHEARPAPVPHPVAAIEPVAAPEMPTPAIAEVPAAPAVPAVMVHRPMYVCRWTKGYGDREMLQKMIVAGEVLGPPLALRKASAGTASAW